MTRLDGGVVPRRWRATDATCVHRPRRAVRRALATLVLPLALIASGCTDAEETTPDRPGTAKVVRGNVSATVSATGSLEYVEDLELDFPVSGKLVQLLVKPGDQVQPGQVLARIDDRVQLAELRDRQAQVAKEEAALGKVVDGNQADAARRDVGRARDIVETLERQKSEAEQANDAAVRRAEKQLEFDREQLRRQEARLAAVIDDCNDIDDVIARQACNDRIEDRRDAVEEARRQVILSKTALVTARRERDLERQERQGAIDTARRALGTAQSDAELASSDRPHNIEFQEESLEQARQAVARTQKLLEDTVLKASVPGRVAAVNGNVGEFVPAPEATAGEEPTLPDGSPRRPSRTDGFIVIDQINSFQVRVPFNEPDAVRMEPGQPAEVTIEPIPGLVRKATVTAVEPVQGTEAGASSFLVTVMLLEQDPRLRNGMSAKVNVILGSVTNVLVIPKAALRGGNSVLVLGPDGAQREVRIELGLIGEELVEVRSGLREGDEVVVPKR